MKISRNRVGSSFRDPSGFLFVREGVLYRQINQIGKDDYDLFLSSGLYDQLVQQKMLVPHQETSIPPEVLDEAYQIIKPELTPFISYPYEWCFSQLKQAALTTLSIQRLAMQVGMSLKDSSAYNIQFIQGRPTLIDTLSFERYQVGQPWAAYRQFCRHFLSPLALMAYCDVRFISLFRVNIDGIPIDLASKLLPRKTYLRPSLLMHLHLHARSIKMSVNRSFDRGMVEGKMSQTALQGLIDSLDAAISGLDWKASGTDWADYYAITNYTDEGFENKKKVVSEYLQRTQAHIVWDLGANTGEFSRLATEIGMFTVSFDLDPAAVEINYQTAVRENDLLMLPLLMDLTNPSPALGWHNNERSSLVERGPADVVLALALIHHLAIGNNVPLDRIARFLRDIGDWLIIEFIPKNDSQVQKMLTFRNDIFTDYDQDHFETAFCEYFQILDVKTVANSLRHIYLMKASASS